MISLVHPGCNANVRAVAQACEEAGFLEEIFTSLSFRGKRDYPVPRNKVKTSPLREIGRLLCRKWGWNSLTQHEKGIFSVDQVWQEIDRRASRRLSQKTTLVYAYEDAAWNVFREANRRGLKKIYDLPIGYWKEAQKIYLEDAELTPEFSSLLEGLKDSPKKLQRKEEELALADRVHASSDFVENTLLLHGFPKEKIRVTHFGAPKIPRFENRLYFQNNKIRILFVGRIDQRKGIGYLLKAIQNFDPEQVELHLVGSKPHDTSALKSYWNRVIDHGTLPQNKVWDLMQRSDLFVLPTLFEGQALVVLEAMACGLPIITTTHAGMGKIIREGIDGFMIPIRSVEKIVEKIHYFLQNPEEISKTGESARNRVLEFTWEKYQKEILHSVMEFQR